MPMHYFIYAILLLFLFYVPTATSLTADDDDLFLTFVKGKPNFEKFCKELEENGKLENIRKLENDNMQSFTNFDQKKDFLIQMYEAHLGVVYLMRKNWKCAEIREEIKHEKKECEKLRKYLDILHEYLFRVHLEAAADQTLSQQLPAVKPHFEFYLGSEELPLKTLTQIVKGLIKILPFFFDQYTNSMYKYKLNEMLIKPPKFSNEWELNYELNANGNGGTLRKLAQKMKQKKNAIGTFREQFDKKLKRMLMNTKQNEAAEMGVLNILEGLKPRNYYKYERNYLRIKNSEHRDKFDIFLSSQFDGTIISSVDEDDIFLAFVKDQSNFGRFCQEKEEDLQYIDYGPTYGFTFDKKKTFDAKIRSSS